MLLKIDDLSRPDHSLLDQQDTCYYIREYTSREGFQASPENQQVFNLKCPINHPNQNRIYYKRQAVAKAAADVTEALAGLQIDRSVFIPIPPSKGVNSPEYDPRVREMLRLAERRLGIRVVEALEVRGDREAAHANDERPSVNEVATNLIVASLDWTDTQSVVIFDDVLVTGTQFKAAIQVLRPHAPNATFTGLFWVRRIFP